MGTAWGVTKPRNNATLQRLLTNSGTIEIAHSRAASFPMNVALRGGGGTHPVGRLESNGSRRAEDDRARSPDRFPLPYGEPKRWRWWGVAAPKRRHREQRWTPSRHSLGARSARSIHFISQTFALELERGRKTPVASQSCGARPPRKATRRASNVVDRVMILLVSRAEQNLRCHRSVCEVKRRFDERRWLVCEVWQSSTDLFVDSVKETRLHSGNVLSYAETCFTIERLCSIATLGSLSGLSYLVYLVRYMDSVCLIVS